MSVARTPLPSAALHDGKALRSRILALAALFVQVPARFDSQFLFADGVRDLLSPNTLAPGNTQLLAHDLPTEDNQLLFHYRDDQHIALLPLLSALAIGKHTIHGYALDRHFFAIEVDGDRRCACRDTLLDQQLACFPVLRANREFLLCKGNPNRVLLLHGALAWIGEMDWAGLGVGLGPSGSWHGCEGAHPFCV